MTHLRLCFLALLGLLNSGLCEGPGPADPGLVEWLTFGGNPQRTSAAGVHFGRLPSRPSWTFRPEPGQWTYRRGISVWSSPSIARVQGRWRVFLGSYDHNLYCLDADTGRKLWAFTAGDGIFSSPVIVNSTRGRSVIFGSADRTIYAVSAVDGTRQWARETFPWKDTVLPARISSGLLWPNNGRPIVFFGVSHADRSWLRKVQEGYLFALDAATGKELWRKKLTNTFVTSPCLGSGPVPSVYAACQDGEVWKLRADTGEIMWRFTANEMIYGSVSLIKIQERPAVVFGTRQNSLYAVDCATGRRIGKFRSGYWIDSTPAALRRQDGTNRIVFGSYDRGVYALDGRTLRLDWKVATGNWVSASPVTVAGPNGPAVIISSLDGTLYLIDGQSGRKLWRYQGGSCLWSHVLQGDAVWAGPAAARMGSKSLLVFPSYSYQVHAFITDSEIRSARP